MKQKQQEDEKFYDEQLIQIIQRTIVECNGYEELKKYIVINKSSFNLIQSQFEKVLEQDNTKIFEQNLLKIIEGLIQNNIQRVYFRVIFQYLKKNKDQMNLKQYQNSGICKFWKNIYCSELNEFIELFELRDQINQKDLLQHYYDMVYKKKFDDAFQYYQALNLSQENFDLLVEQMIQNNDASKAADFIKKQGLDPMKYPKIVEKLQFGCIRYLSREYLWFKCEEMLMFSQQLLIQYCQEAYFNGYKNEALSIIKRNNILNEIKKKQLKEQVEKDFQEGFVELPNTLFVKDEFKATEEFINNEVGVYLFCQDLGYSQNQIILVDKIDQNYFDAWKCINSSKAIGYDCENVTPWTKLDIQGFKVCLIQIATLDYAFLFDFQKLKNYQEFKDNMKQLLENVEILKIGLNLKDDLKSSVGHLKLKNVIIRSILELQSSFKLLEEDPKIRSLAYITEYYFKKKLSKYETCSNWEYRPLRKAQIHYAALDAIVCLHIYLKMKEKNSQLLENEKDVLTLG